ncbi:multidrug transporter [Altericroceibacterium xinjiangense]|uniref:multidrug transporter n=1 Tax=Altericroceibacterium xinjiangense TaxID=762261 RepID=UPI000F7EA1B2|nr:multidrug transporter [Altericroceibacterium xinjiangense]
MEAACAVSFPLLAAWMVEPDGGREIAGVVLAVTASCCLLAVGALYWHAALCRVRGNPEPMRHALRIARRLKRPLLALAIASLVWAVFLCFLDPSSAALAALGFSALAVLEYVNYYHVQLQNFDHLPDFKRLLRRRRLRQAHLAADLKKVAGER